MVALNFDATNVQPSAAPDPIPAGWYTCQITRSETKPTANGLGKYLELEFTVMDGPFTGRKVVDRLNIENQNAQAQEIAYATLSAICHATGIIQIQDSTALHNIPLSVKVTVKPATGQYDANNDIRGYKLLSGGAAQAGGQVMQNPAAQVNPAPVNTTPVNQLPQNNQAPVYNPPPVQQNVAPVNTTPAPVQQMVNQYGQPVDANGIILPAQNQVVQQNQMQTTQIPVDTAPTPQTGPAAQNTGIEAGAAHNPVPNVAPTNPVSGVTPSGGQNPNTPPPAWAQTQG